PIAFVELDASMRNRTGPVGSHDDSFIEIEVANTSVCRRSNFITKTDVQREVWSDVIVILHKLRQIPVARRVETTEEILLIRRRIPVEQVGEPIASERCARVGAVRASEDKPAARAGQL